MDKKYFIVIMATMLVLAGAFFVVSYNTDPVNPVVMGHSVDEIEGWNESYLCKSDGTDCNFAPRKSIYSGCTATKYSGNLGGYSGADDKCAVEFSGSRMCNTQDMPRILDSIEEGCYGVLNSFEVSCAVSVSSNYGGGFSVVSSPCDCNRWTSTSGARVILSKHRGYVDSIVDDNCYPSYSLHCCKD